jgi:hypothetical protein
LFSTKSKIAAAAILDYLYSSCTCKQNIDPTTNNNLIIDLFREQEWKVGGRWEGMRVIGILRGIYRGVMLSEDSTGEERKCVSRFELLNVGMYALRLYYHPV